MNPPTNPAAASMPPRSVSTRIVVPTGLSMVSLLGSGDALLRVVESLVTTDIHVRGNEITLTGTPQDNALAAGLFEQLLLLLERSEVLTPESIERSHAMLIRGGAKERPADVLTLNILSNRGRTIRPKTVNQKRYVEAIDKHTIVFGIGPAGTGKTYLAIAKAVQALQAKAVNRIILTRPAVEAGERLGFLPGTLLDKIDPYLRPLYDALHDMLDPEAVPRLMQQGTIEVAPLAYMRGRAQPVETPVLTPHGFRPIGGLEVGDLVTGSDGTPTPVLGVYPQGHQDTYRVTTQDGASTYASGDHLWFVSTASGKRRGRGGRVLRTTDMIGKLRAARAWRYELPVVKPVQMVAQDVPMDPYAMGLLLGDGCLTTSTTPAFATADPELAEALANALPEVVVARKTDVDHVLGNPLHRPGSLLVNPVTEVLRDLGLAGTRSTTKFVPVCYLDNTLEVRQAVLQGLLDTDGGPVRQRDRTCRVQYTSCSPRLRDDVILLVRSLGGVAYVRTRAAEGRSPGGTADKPIHFRNDAYVVDIRLPPEIAPFRMRRKVAAYDQAGGGGRPMRHIDRIEPVGEMDCVCISVGAQDSLYVTEDFIVTHNTLNDAFIILDEAQNTSAEQMKMFLTRLGFGSQVVVTGDVTQVDLPSGATSGLRVVQDILEGVEDVHFARLNSDDVVRHKLVARIVDAYDSYDAEQERSRGPIKPRPVGRLDDRR